MSSSEPLPASVRHGYGVTAFSIAIANTAVLFFLLKYLVDGAGLAPSTVGWVLLVGKVWDGAIDPFVGRWVDGTRTSYGSRRPWLIGAAVPFTLLFAALWWGLPLQGMALAVGYAILIMAYNTAYTLIQVPYGALTPALTADYDERTRLNGARMAWSMLGGIVCAVAFPILLLNGGWHVAGAVLALLIAPPIFVTVWATRGRDPVGPAETQEDPRGMWSVLRNRPFRRTAALFLCAWSAIAVLGSLIPFYVEHHLGHPEMLDLVLIAIQLSALAAIPGVVWVADRFEKHRSYAVGVALWAVVLLGLAAVPAGTGYPMLILAALAGPGVAAAHVLPWAMLPDVVEADAAETGLERAGAFYGVMTFLEQVGTALAMWAVSQSLGYAGYIEKAVEQPESARQMIRFLIGPMPGAVLLAAALGAWFLPPMTREAHRAMVAALAERKARAALSGARSA